MDSSSLVLCLLNAYLSYITIMLNIATTLIVVKKFKNTASYLSVGLLSQAMFVTYLFVESKQNNETTKSLNAIRIAFLTPTKFICLIYIVPQHRFVCREIRVYLFLPQIPRTCDAQTRCCCISLAACLFHLTNCK